MRKAVASLAAEILASAKPRSRKCGWYERLNDEQRSVVDEVRSGWQATRNATGVSATQMARTMIAGLADKGYALPQPKEVARWLTSVK